MKKNQFIMSIIGGFIGAALFFTIYSIINLYNFSANKAQAGGNVITVTGINLIDNKGRLRAQLGYAKEGPPAFWLNDEQGVARLTFGLYPDSTAYFGLQDAQGQMIQLMRSFGPKNTPLLIFKHKSQDMMITGLNPTSDPVPFLMTYDSARKKNINFGKYDGP